MATEGRGRVSGGRCAGRRAVSDGTGSGSGSSRSTTLAGRRFGGPRSAVPGPGYPTPRPACSIPRGTRRAGRDEVVAPVVADLALDPTLLVRALDTWDAVERIVDAVVAAERGPTLGSGSGPAQPREPTPPQSGPTATSAFTVQRSSLMENKQSCWAWSPTGSGFDRLSKPNPIRAPSSCHWPPDGCIGQRAR
jgi:hypothetical protein